MNALRKLMSSKYQEKKSSLQKTSLRIRTTLSTVKKRIRKSLGKLSKVEFIWWYYDETIYDDDNELLDEESDELYGKLRLEFLQEK